ncbi:5 formyltetrahydrofolate cyclo ligase [Trichuris trichiura]|uniref:5-formyltetrahydrofolate cyclo-ligase n=1 Tax=Trichuris trichiura TaxID=36087 RepID=A0A077ZA77_TRITR|nr:5 formyltetrahydrofolate cyclo ligase [Trichuris trichiura]
MEPFLTQCSAAVKRGIRKKVVGSLRLADSNDLQEQSTIIFSKLKSHPAYLASERVSVYLSTPVEVDTTPIVKDLFGRNKVCFVPLFEKDCNAMDMVRMHSLEEVTQLPETIWNIRQPLNSIGRESSLNSRGVDLVITPGVAFTSSGQRLGHGKGYYDRYFERHFQQFGRTPLTIGLAFREQILESLPITKYDHKLDFVISP